MPRVPDELLAILTSFHREVMLPDMQRIADATEARLTARFDDVAGHFDAVYQRFDRLEGVEQRLGGIEQKLDRLL